MDVQISFVCRREIIRRYFLPKRNMLRQSWAMIMFGRKHAYPGNGFTEGNPKEADGNDMYFWRSICLCRSPVAPKVFKSVNMMGTS